MSVPHPSARVRPGRRIQGMSAVLLPFEPGGAIDWAAYRGLLERTRDAGLVPAVNMDTGYVQLLDDATREKVLDTAREIARDIAANAAPLSAAVSKQLLWESFALGPEEVEALLADGLVRVDAHRACARVVEEPHAEVTVDLHGDDRQGSKLPLELVTLCPHDLQVVLPSGLGRDLHVVRAPRPEPRGQPHARQGQPRAEETRPHGHRQRGEPSCHPEPTETHTQVHDGDSALSSLHAGLPPEHHQVSNVMGSAFGEPE